MSTKTPAAKDSGSTPKLVKSPQPGVSPAQTVGDVPAVPTQLVISNPGVAHPTQILALQRKAGNQAVHHLLIQPGVQAKRMGGGAHEVDEQEADHLDRPAANMAEQVVSQPSVAPVQRHADQEQEIQAKASSGGDGFDPGADFESRLNSQQGGGNSLPGETREFMENRFGADFSGVRMHSDSTSVQLNREVQAQAFTHGQDIYLGEGKSDLDSTQGKHLLAHELTHVVQQGGAQGRTAQRQLTTPSGRTLQRHPQGAELPEKEDQVSEVSEKENLKPEATRTKKEEKTEKSEGKTAGKEFTKSQKLTPGAMSLASAEKILQGAFGGLKKIVPGSIVVLANQAACSAKYDEVCMAAGVLHEGVAWQPGDCAKDDAALGVQTEGFAWEGVVYVNGETTLVTATAHEILHNNAEPKFRAKVGETFNEGVTETLARRALSQAGVKVPSVTAYPEQIKLTKLLIDRVGIDVVEKAYFGNVQDLVDAYTGKCSGTWAELVLAAEALDTDNVKVALKRGKRK